MNREEFGRIMKTLNDLWGGYGPATYDSWFQVLEKYPCIKVSTAVWGLAETLKTKPRIADIMEAMGRDTVGGGSGQVQDYGCDMCASGWVMVEIQPGVMAGMRCMCVLGDSLNPQYAKVTPDHIKARRWTIRGELKFFDAAAMERENKLGKLDTNETIAWCRKGLVRMANNMRF